MAFKTVGQLLHIVVKRLNFPHRAQVVAICFVLRQTDDLPISQLNQQRDVSPAYRRAQLAASRQRLGL